MLMQRCEGATYLKGTMQRPKLLLCPDGTILKFIYARKKLISSSYFKPYAKRILKNSQYLQAMGIPAMNVQEAFHCQALGCDVVTYPDLKAENVLSLLNKTQDISRLMKKFAHYLAWLHEQGVFFWDLHLQNVLMNDEGTFFLIDIASLKIYKPPLNFHKRFRNIKRLLRIEEKSQVFIHFGVAKFLHDYVEAAGFTVKQQNRFIKKLGV